MNKTLLLISGLFILISCSNSDNSSVIDPPDDNVENPQTGFFPCQDGMAGIYPCNGYDLLGQISLADFNASIANDIWGWTDSSTGKEYALVGLDNGTAFVDITDTEELIYLGKLPTATTSSTWRDIKVYQDHAFIVSEAGGHGMQVFDLTKLRNVANAPENFEADTRYTGFGNAHNIVINEASGYAYAVGTDTFNGGAHFIDIGDPKNPIAAGGYGANGYSHDAQVETYNGPDANYTGQEIFIGANENQVAIVNVTDKNNPQQISTFQYANIGYTHQGWFSEDQRYFILGDETDELTFGFDSRTLIFDLSDLDNPVLFTTYSGETAAIDHNGYVKGEDFYLANYTAGVRILDISGIDGQTIVEKGFFDTYPANNTAAFEGVWSVYPYFESEKIIVNDINSGLFIIKSSN
ncbi:MAG: choice-of-anchor B family protein [Flavobacteriaceae bacterium]|nr:MAG: choice-of-anchor B family protein [Flavobacteriaceae bacterium]